MKTAIFLGLIIAFVTLSACTGSKHGHTKGYNFQEIAWNEDTLHSCYLVLSANNKFSYIFINRENKKQSKFLYTGTFRYVPDDNSGKVFLTYEKGRKPKGIVDFLIVETQRNYLFQHFENNQPRMYLRIQKGVCVRRAYNTYLQ